jgi:Tol biopolymer transport system component
MSRVFEATDVRLGRQVVVKMLSPDIGSSVSIERFKREIQVAVRLQHPHIVPVLVAGEADGLPFYLMPLVKGESLGARLARSGPLSVNDLLHVLRDVAAALAHAHAEGVVHRDIKPENVILSGGVAVVTDFGVSKAMDAATMGSAASAGGLTSVGVALGTPAYIAPEQATADPHVDQRADIYAFGCMAYEMSIGSSPFAGRSARQQLAAHVTEAPVPIAERAPGLPARLADLIMKCLRKNPADRPQSAAELIAAIDAITTSGDIRVSPHQPARVTRAAPYLLTGAGVVALAGLLLSTQRPEAPSFTIAATSPVALSAALEMEPAISPDGRLIAYAAETPEGSRIFVRQIEGGRPVPVTAELDGNHRWPRWSPDQTSIVFAANDAAYVVPAFGGSPRRVVESPNGSVRTPAWSPDGRQIAYGDDAGIQVRQLYDTTAARLLVQGASLHSPSWSPDGSRIAYAHGLPIALTNISTNSIWIVAGTGGSSRRISDSVHVNVSPVWASDGRSVFYVSNLGGALDVYQQAVRSDGTPTGPPRRLTTTLNAHTITLSVDGTRLASDVALNRSAIWMAPMDPGGVARTSSATRLTEENESIEGLSLSHDGNWLAYDSNRRGNFDIYKVRTDGRQSTQLTSHSTSDFIPSWSPDDREIAFHSTRNGTRDIFIVNAEGGTESQVTSGPSEDFAPSWSADGRSLVFRTMQGGAHRASVVTRDATAGWSPPRVVTPDSIRHLWANAAWSPDGKVIAFMNNDMVATVDTDGTVRVLTDNRSLGGRPVSVTWGPGSAELYVTVVRDRTAVVAVPVGGGGLRTILVEDGAHRMRPEVAVDHRRVFFTVTAWESDVWILDLKR